MEDPTPMRRFLIAGLLACTCLQPALAVPITYDEATDGDLVGIAGIALPILVLDVGSNTITGRFGLTGTTADFDNFAFFVPSGLEITSGSVALSAPIGRVDFSAWEFFSGTNISGSGTSLGIMNALALGSVAAPGLPLGAGTYNLSHFSFGADTNSTASYIFEFVVEAVDAPVPEPATAVVLGAGLAALGLSRRRRSA